MHGLLNINNTIFSVVFFEKYNILLKKKYRRACTITCYYIYVLIKKIDVLTLYLTS